MVWNWMKCVDQAKHKDCTYLSFGDRCCTFGARVCLSRCQLGKACSLGNEENASKRVTEEKRERA